MNATEERVRDALRGLDAVPVPDGETAEAAVRSRAARQVRRRRHLEATVLAVGILASGGAGVWAWSAGGDVTPADQVVVTPGAGPGATASTLVPATTAGPAPVVTGTTGHDNSELSPVPGTTAHDNVGASPVTGTTTSPVVGEPQTTVATFDGPRDSLEYRNGDRQVFAQPWTKDGADLVLITIFSGRDGLLGTVEVPVPGRALDIDGRIQGGDLTGDGSEDYVVPLMAAQPIGVVATDDGGTWHLAPILLGDGQTTDVFTGIQPRIGADGRLEIQYRSCDPTCAEGLTEWRPWIYEGGVFVPAS
jgi:hypothetical protein